jgi:hypothetical protein
MHDGCLQAISQREDFGMRALASRTAQHCHAAIAIEEHCEPIDIDACRHHDGLAGQQSGYFRRRCVKGGLQSDIARDD